MNNQNMMKVSGPTELSGGADLVEKLVQLGGTIKPQVLQTPNGESDPFILVPQGAGILNLASVCPPQRIEKTVRLQDVESFCAYVKRFQTEDSLIFCNLAAEGCTFLAVLDYHGAAPALIPHYCKHIARYDSITTPEWAAIRGNSGVQFNQVNFATFLEDNQKLFVNPKGAELLELIKTLHGHRNARFNTSLRLDNGAFSVQYDEDVVVKGSSVSKGGEFNLPDKIHAAMKVFVGGDNWEVTARLKTRCEARTLTIWYEIIGRDEILRENMLSLVRKISKDTDIIPLLGSV